MKLYQLLFLGFVCLFSFVKLAEINGGLIEITGSPNKRARIEAEDQEEAKCCICLQNECDKHLSKISCGHKYHPICLNQAFSDESSNLFKCFECETEISYDSAFISFLRTKELPEGFCCHRDKFGDDFVKRVYTNAMKHEPVGVISRMLRVRFPIHSKSRTGTSVLHIASVHGTPEKIEKVIRSGLPLARSVDQMYQIVFVSALLHGNNENINYAVSRGLDFKNLQVNGRSVMNFAIESNSSIAVKWLIDRDYDVNKKFEVDEDYPIHCAIKCDNTEAVRMLLAAGADAEVLNGLNRSPLFSACYLGQLGSVKLLMEHGVRTNIFTAEGYNVFHYAIVPGHLDIAKYFIERGFSIAMKNGKKCYVLHRVVYSDFPEMVKYLLAIGASPYETFDDATYQFLLKDFPNVNGRLAMLDPPIVVAILYNFVDIVKAFLEAGFNANRRIFNVAAETSLLHLAFEMDHLEIARLLIKHGADVNSLDAHGYFTHYYLDARHTDFRSNMDQYLEES